VFVSNKIEGLKQDNQNQLMSAIPEGTTFYLKFGYKIKVNSIVFPCFLKKETSAGGLLFPKGIISPVVSVPVLAWFIRYIYY
jgi:hypothetical protein